ncbi:MAG TPA: uroporphyrinogen decarboxylase [Caulobacteraceae bacterium]|nr:uroporphyrinogen decarboxylase [Caulobacteraceae bacterium]
MTTPIPKLVKVLAGQTGHPPPIWFMRQAGRTLPEYHALRASTSDFIAFCLDPEKAAEATLQPVRRFAFDAAIVFADILLLPHALGQEVWFEAGEGPHLGPLPELAALAGETEAAVERLEPVGQTLARVRAALEPERALIGFAGGPWTVATYMIQGRGGEREAARSLAFAEPEKVQGLVDLLAEVTARYLAMQARAGAQVLQIFESWAELLPEDVFERLVIRPHRRIVDHLRAEGVRVPVIGFPRGAGALVEPYAERAGVEGVGLDVQAPAALGRRLQRRVAIQGALDPLLLRAGGSALERRVDQLLEQWRGGPYIFNLGHGVLPDTPIDHIAWVVERVTKG